MRKITLLCFLVLAGMFSYGQYYYIPHIAAGENPGGLNTDLEYPVGGGIPAGWNVIQGPSASPAWSSIQTLPFTFDFNGAPVTSYKVSTSGVLTFTTGTALAAPQQANQIIPNALVPDNSICIWGLGAAGSNDNIVVKTFGAAPNRQYWVSFNSYTGETSWQYWSIVLEETTNKIYIVDQRFSAPVATLTLGIQISSTLAVQVTGSPNIGNTCAADPSPADNSYYEFIPGAQVQYDIWMKTMDLYPIQAIASAPFTLAGKLTNLGTDTVNSIVLNYTVDNGAAVSDTITGLNILPYGTYTYTHNQTWTPLAIGNYLVKVFVSTINDSLDQNHSNDTVIAPINVVAQIIQRMPLLEAFTSSTCPPCVQGNINLGNVMTANPNKWTCVKYQMSWPSPGDPYYTDEGGERRTFYGVNSVPQLQVDGPGFASNTQSYTSPMLLAEYAKPAFINLTATCTLSGKSVSVAVNANPVADFPSSDMKLHIAIIEYETQNNVGSNGETSFNYVMKKMVPDANGTTLAPMVSGTPYTNTFNYTFHGNYRLPANAGSPINHAIEHSVEQFTDLGAVVWIQDEATKEVFQSCFATVILGTSEVGDNNGIMALYPNPSSDQTTLRYFLSRDANVGVEILNMMGQKVYGQEEGQVSWGANTLSIDTRNLPVGMYVLRLSLGEKVFTTKLNIAE